MAIVWLAVFIATGQTAEGARSKQPGWPVAVTETTPSLSRHLSPEANAYFGKHDPNSPNVITVDDRIHYQQMLGFGGAMTDSSAWLIHDKLAPAVRTRAMQALFGADGLRLNFVRVPIGSSDFSATGIPYSYDDLPAGKSDPRLAKFSIAHDLRYIIPTLRRMRRINPGAAIIATPWSPPPWMKTNDAFDALSPRATLLPADFQPLAHYFVKFIEAYAGHGLPIAAITPRTEPRAATSYPSMVFAASDEASFISAYLRPTLAAAGLHPKIFGGDVANLTYVQRLFSTGVALDGIAWHCYAGTKQMGVFHEHPAVAEILSECSPGIVPYSVAETVISAADNWASVIDLWDAPWIPRADLSSPRTEVVMAAVA